MTYRLGDNLSVDTLRLDGGTQFETRRDGESISVVYLPEDEAASLLSKLEETAQ